MFESDSNYANEFADVQKKKKGFKKNVLFIVLTIVLSVVAFFYIVTVYIPERENIKKYINSSYEDVDEIQLSITDGEYIRAIDMLKDYEYTYSDEYRNEKYYKKLPKEMCAETIVPQYLGVMVQTLDKNINESMSKLDSLTFDVNDRDKVSAIVNELGALYSEYPNGINYTTESGDELFYNIEKMYDEYYYRYRCEEIILDYHHISDKSMKHYAISNMDGLANVENLNSELKNRVLSQLAKMKSENKATDFAVTGGSAEVYLMKNYKGEYVRNYGWICPKCGYDGGAVGAPLEVSAKGHYIGETETLTRMMSCAGKWVGGCGGLSTYTIEITYK